MTEIDKEALSAEKKLLEQLGDRLPEVFRFHQGKPVNTEAVAEMIWLHEIKTRYPRDYERACLVADAIRKDVEEDLRGKMN